MEAESMNKPYFTRTNKILEVCSWILLLVSFAIAVYGMCTLPDTIPTHFALDGTPNGYGSPGALLVFPIIMLFTLGIISLVAHLLRPEEWNMPFQVKERHKNEVFACILSMMFLIELESAVLTLFIQVQSVQLTGKGALPTVGIYVVAMTATIIILWVKAGKINNKL